MWGALSDERTGLSVATVPADSDKCVSVCTINILHVFKCIYSIYKASVSPGPSLSLSLSNEMTGESFTIAAGLRQRNHFRVR
jgi:hypothetical protein